MTFFVIEVDLPLCLMGFHDRSSLVVFVVDRFVADWKISPVYEQQ